MENSIKQRDEINQKRSSLRKADVVVIGAGPAGSITAKNVAEAGFDVLLVERARFPGETNVCAGAIRKSLHKELNLSTSVIEKKIFGHVSCYPWGKIEKIGSTILTLTVRRRIFDRYLAQQAVKSGSKLLPFTKVCNVVKDKNRVFVFMRNRKSGEDTKVESKIVVFADGPHTLSYRKFPGLGIDGKLDKMSLAVIYEIEWKNNPMNNMENYYDLRVSPFGYGWIYPKKHVLNVGVYCLASKLKRSIKEHLDFLVRKHPEASKILRGKRILKYSSGLVPSAPAKRIFGESMLVVGDAAGMVHPFSGEGIQFAINGAKIAARTVKKALDEENFSAQFLSQYQKEWEKTTDFRLIKNSYWLMRAFLKLTNLDKNAYLKLRSLASTKYGIFLSEDFLRKFPPKVSPKKLYKKLKRQIRK